MDSSDRSSVVDSEAETLAEEGCNNDGADDSGFESSKASSSPPLAGKAVSSFDSYQGLWKLVRFLCEHKELEIFVSPDIRAFIFLYRVGLVVRN